MKDLREDVGAFLESARSIRREISARIREGLEEAGRDRRAKTSEMLASCQEHRSQAASALRQELAGGRAARLEEAGQLKEEFAEGTALWRAEIVRLQEETINFLTDSHALLKASLAEAKAERLLGLQEMRDEVNRLRKEFADEREVLRVYIRDAAAAWQGPRAAEETPVSGDSVPAEIAAPIFPEEVRPEKISAEARQEEPVRVGAAEEKEPVDEVSSWGGEDIRTKILAVVGANPGGVTLTEVAEKLGMATVALGRTSRDLSDEGKIRREGKHYFPVPD
jgi:hypothetical protein